MATHILSSGYVTTGVAPWGSQWKKMRRVLIADVFNQSRVHWLLGKRNEEADNLVKFLYNQCSVNPNGSVVNVKTAALFYSGGVMRRMIFNSRVFDIGGHAKKVRDALKITKQYQDPVINERLQEWRDGKRTEPADLLDVFISLKDANGLPLLSSEEIKAQITMYLAYVNNPYGNTEPSPKVGKPHLPRGKPPKNCEISVYYAVLDDVWNWNKMIVDDAFAYSVSTNITFSDDIEPRSVDEC
nr:isoleucine N-monooxygenase 1-like [Malus domestica]